MLDYGVPKPRNGDNDAPIFQPLKAEEEVARVTSRFADAAASDSKGRSLSHDLSHAEQRRAEAQQWKVDNGFAKTNVMSFRMSELEAALVWTKRKMFGRARDEACAKIQVEIQRRRAGGLPVMPDTQAKKRNRSGNSHRGGRQSNASKNITLPHVSISTGDTADHDGHKR